MTGKGTNRTSDGKKRFPSSLNHDRYRPRKLKMLEKIEQTEHMPRNKNQQTAGKNTQFFLEFVTMTLMINEENKTCQV